MTAKFSSCKKLLYCYVKNRPTVERVPVTPKVSSLFIKFVTDLRQHVSDLFFFLSTIPFSSTNKSDSDNINEIWPLHINFPIRIPADLILRNTLYYASLEFRIYSLMFGNGHCLRTPITKEKPAGTISKHNDWLEINTSSNSICHCFALTRIAWYAYIVKVSILFCTRVLTVKNKNFYIH